MSVIGGIKYRGDIPSSGDLDGVCCNDCLNHLYQQLRDGTAVVDAAHVDNAHTTLRYRILRMIHHLGTPLPRGAFRRFMVTGEAPTNSNVTSDIGYTGVSSRLHGTPDYKLRMAMAYLWEFYKSPDYLSHYSTAHGYCDAVDQLVDVSTSFVCRDCQETITDPTAILAGVHMNEFGGLVDEGVRNLCGDCLSAEYIYCDYQGIYADNDTEIVTVAGMAGNFTLEYAQSNFRWVDAEEDEDGDEESEGYWTNNRVQPTDSLMHYDANPFDFFKWDKRNKQNALVFGVELEMEPSRSTETQQRALITALGGSTGKNFILKSDGSLNNGVELVTMPFTLAQHLDGSGVPWVKTLEAVKTLARSGAGTTSCGIHIHINKKALSALTIGKMLVFLNDPGLAPLITIIAQRASSSYCTRSVKKLTDGTRSSESRYDIMNVSVRHPTCEIRMFRGNVTPERVFKNIEFCHALIQYCRQSSMRTLTDWGNFSTWLIAHRGQYQNLVRFLIDQKAVGFRQLARDSRDGTITIEDR